MPWDGQDRRDGDRRGCEWPACGAKNDADAKHKELREDLGEIKINQKQNGEEFRKLTEVMQKVVHLKEDFLRLEASHNADVARVEEKQKLADAELRERQKLVDAELKLRPSYRELYTYAGIIAFSVGIIEFVVLFFTR